MKIHRIKINHLTITLVAAALITLSGMASTIPEFAKAFKDYRATSAYKDADVKIHYADVSPVFYERAARAIRPQYPDFNVVDENASLTVSSSRIENHGKIGLLVTELKALEPGIAWSVDQACIGRKCAEAIKITLVAKKLTINN